MSEAIILPQFIPPTPDLSNYALKAHTHSEYASSSHSHSGYASSSHSHSGYATTSWVTANFAPKGSSGTTTPGGGSSTGSVTVTIKAGWPMMGSATIAVPSTCLKIALNIPRISTSSPFGISNTSGSPHHRLHVNLTKSKGSGSIATSDTTEASGYNSASIGPATIMYTITGIVTEVTVNVGHSAVCGDDDSYKSNPGIVVIPYTLYTV